MDSDKITLAHGSGGVLMQELINKLILGNFGNKILNRLDDSAVFSLKDKDRKIAFTTDSFVVSPIFFPGGDIGRLAVCGTVNDLAMMGAIPLFLSAGVIIEEGFDTQSLNKIIVSMKKALDESNTTIICGDTKVVDKGSCDKIFINTAGIGIIGKGIEINSANAQPGDVIIASGTIGEHGISILSQREGLRFKTKLKSDCAPLNNLVKRMLKYAKAIHVLRDPTRGGVASVLNEVAEHSNVGIEIEEVNVPLSGPVKGACEILGLDPLYLPSEGRLLAFVHKNKANEMLQLMKKDMNAKNAVIIGSVVANHKSQVYLRTLTGGLRTLDVLVHEQMPRIC